MSGNDKKGGSPVLRAMAVGTSVSTEMAATIVLGYYGGSWLDGRLHTGPWFLLAGVLLGLAAGILGIVKTLQAFFGAGGE